MFIFWTKCFAKSIRYKRILHVSSENKPYFKIIINLLCLEFFLKKVNPVNLESLKKAKNARGSSEFPNQNLREIGERVHEFYIYTYRYTAFRFQIYIPEVWVQLLRNLKPFRLVELGVLELQPSWNLSWEENIFSVLVHFSPARLEPCSASPPRRCTRR